MPFYPIKQNACLKKPAYLANAKRMPAMKYYLESFYKKLQIEARVIGELVNNVIIPAAITYQTKLVENVRSV
jgi:glutamine synthetase type III